MPVLGLLHLQGVDPRRNRHGAPLAVDGDDLFSRPLRDEDPPVGRRRAGRRRGDAEPRVHIHAQAFPASDGHRFREADLARSVLPLPVPERVYPGGRRNGVPRAARLHDIFPARGIPEQPVIRRILHPLRRDEVDAGVELQHRRLAGPDRRLHAEVGVARAVLGLPPHDAVRSWGQRDLLDFPLEGRDLTAVGRRQHLHRVRLLPHPCRGIDAESPDRRDLHRDRLRLLLQRLPLRLRERLVQARRGEGEKRRGRHAVPSHIPAMPPDRPPQPHHDDSIPDDPAQSIKKARAAITPGYGGYLWGAFSPPTPTPPLKGGGE